MAPATVAGVQRQAQQGRGRGWDRDSIIIAIQEWVATYGQPPRAADWNPSSAKWAGQLWRVERYRAGRADGSPWPALNSAKRPFGGSLTAAIVAAGFEPAKPGPVRRTSVDPVQADRAVISPEGRAMVAAALAQAREAEARVRVLEARLERAATKKTKTKIVRERVVDDAAVARAQRRATGAEAKGAATVADAGEEVAAGRMAAAEARTPAKRLAARLERAEATIATLRDERRTLKADLVRDEDRVTALERLLAAAREEAGRTETITITEQAPEAAELRAAVSEAASARRAAEAAEVRAARAERELRETVSAIRGEARRLTAAELAELRANGPTGPAVLAAALQQVAEARKAGSPTELRGALRALAEAAITWEERL